MKHINFMHWYIRLTQVLLCIYYPRMGSFPKEQFEQIEEYPEEDYDFEEQFSNEDRCLKLLSDFRWPNGYICPKCKSTHYWKTNRNLYHCANCGYQASIFMGTIFHGTRTPLKIWLNAIWKVASCDNGISARKLQRELNIRRYETTWEMLHKIRKIMIRPGQELLSGNIEIDLAFIRLDEKDHQFQDTKGDSLVLVSVEKTGIHLGKIRLTHIPSASPISILSAIKNNIKLDSEIQTNRFPDYSLLTVNGYKHRIVRTEYCIGENLLPAVSHVFSRFKKWLLDSYKSEVREAYLQAYLDEFSFRFNQRTSKEKLFYRLIGNSVTSICI